MKSKDVLLSIRNLKKYFPTRKKSLFEGKQTYLRANEDVSFDVRVGETFGLVGESGCGKSTLGRTILQLYKPTAGEVVYYKKRDDQAPACHLEEEGVNLTKLSVSEMRKYRKDLQIVFQDPYSSLNPKMTVGQLIEEGVEANGYYQRGTKEMKEYVAKVMADCGLSSEWAHHYPHQFSGGQRQRVAIARALAVKPKFIVCDECVSALDVSIQAQILNLLRDLKEKEGITYLFISHDLSVVRYVSDRIGVMYLGRIVEQGEAEEVFLQPRHPYTIALISAIPSLGERREAQILLSGPLPSPVSPPSGCPFHTRCYMAQDCCKHVPAPMIEVNMGHFVACHLYKDYREN